MSFNVEPDNLWREVQSATEYNQRFLGANYEDDKRRYAGAGYRGDWAQDEPDMENHAFEWVSLFASMVLSSNPRVKTSTPRGGTMRDLVRASGYAINRNIVDTDMVSMNELLFYDWAFRWCVALTVQEPAAGDYTGWSDPPFRPRSKRISPLYYVADPMADTHEGERWRGHGMIVDKETLLRDARALGKSGGWNTKMIDALPEEAGVDELRRSTERGYGGGTRGEVTLYEVWVPEERLEKAVDANGEEFEPLESDGYHGVIYTIPHGGGTQGLASSDYIRKPRPFYGPTAGPYTVGGAYLVPDENRYLSPIAAVVAQAAELNTHRRSMSARMADYKKGFAVDSTSIADLGSSLAEFEDHGIFPVNRADNIAAQIKELEIGGLTDQDLRHFMFLRETLERVSGLHDAQRGGTARGVTATATAIANQSSTRRSGHLAMKFVKTLEAVLRKEAWYLVEDSRSAVRLGPEAGGLFLDPVTGEPIEEPVWKGGDLKFEDMEMSVDFYSVSQTSEEQEQARASAVDQIVMTALPMVRSFPEFDWETYFAERGEALGMPQLPKLFNYEAARMMGAMQMEMQQPLPDMHPKQGTPRLPGNVQPDSVWNPGVGFSGAGGMRPGAGMSAAGDPPDVPASVQKGIE